MTYRISLAQVSHPVNGDVASLVDKAVSQAKLEGASLIIFPESLMTPFELDAPDFADKAQGIDGGFIRAVSSIAQNHGMWMICTMNEQSTDPFRPYNTALLLDSSGKVQCIYRKTHLFDSKTVCESKRMSSGNAIPAQVRTPLGCIGLEICYDLRFPELSRILTLEGCDLLAYPAAWVDGEAKEMQWRTLLQARAIENGIFVAGVCRPDAGYVGKSYLIAPDGRILAESQKGADEIVTADVDLSEIAKVRACIPSLEHRRKDIYTLGRT